MQDCAAPSERGSFDGSLRLSSNAAEWAEWQASEELLNRWFGPGTARRMGADEVEAAGYGRGHAGGVEVAGDGAVDLPALVARLAGSVVPISGRAQVVSGSGDGVLLQVDDRTLRAELVVVAAGPGAASVHPWFGPMLYPVRLQGLRTAPQSTRWPRPALARHRLEAWVQEASGALTFVGCRWAEQPEMEAGVTDDSTISPLVEAGQRRFLDSHLPGALDAGGLESWTGITTTSCDGLPLVGPLPGNPRLLALAGWGGWGLSWMGAAVIDVCDAALGRPGAPVPAEVAARRML